MLKLITQTAQLFCPSLLKMVPCLPSHQTNVPVVAQRILKQTLFADQQTFYYPIGTCSLFRPTPLLLTNTARPQITPRKVVSSEEIQTELVRLGCKETEIMSILGDGATDIEKQRLLLTDMLFEKITNSENSNIIDDRILALVPSLVHSNGLNLFLFSVARGHEGNVEKIYQRFEDDDLIFQKDDQGRTALHLAAINGHNSLFKVLFKKNLGGLEDKDNDGLIPLHWAILKGQTDVVKTILEEGCAPSSPLVREDGEQMSPLSMAIASGDPEILELLLKNDHHQALSLDCPIHGIGNVLHLAIRYNQSLMLKHILRERHKDTDRLLNQEDKEGRTPLQLAAFLGDLLAIRLLHQQDANLNRTETKTGRTALHYAADGEQELAIQLLVSSGATVTPLDRAHKTPMALIEKRETSKAKKCRNLLSRLQASGIKDSTQPPKFNLRLPQNLVFQGGGPKGIAYIGAIQKMEEFDALTELKRLAGTSAGAIIAALLAVGYRGQDLEQHLSFDFTKFLDHKDQLTKALLTAGEAKSGLQVIQALWREYWGSWQALLDPLQRADMLRKKLMSITGICEGEAFRKWIEQLICKATGITHCTFQELRDLTKKNPEKYKELHIFAVQIQNREDIVRFSSEEPRWEHLVISDAVRASMSIPGAFTPHTLHFKYPSKERQSQPTEGRFVDGGLARNFPLDAFDNEKYQEDRHRWGEKTNRRTLGLRLSSDVPSMIQAVPDINSPISLAKSLLTVYYHAQDMLFREKEHHQHLAISIPTQDVGLLDFDVSEEKKAAMKTSGREAVMAVFSDDSEKKK